MDGIRLLVRQRPDGERADEALRRHQPFLLAFPVGQRGLAAPRDVLDAVARCQHREVLRDRYGVFFVCRQVTAGSPALAVGLQAELARNDLQRRVEWELFCLLRCQHRADECVFPLRAFAVVARGAGERPVAKPPARPLHIAVEVDVAVALQCFGEVAPERRRVDGVIMGRLLPLQLDVGDAAVLRGECDLFRPERVQHRSDDIGADGRRAAPVMFPETVGVRLRHTARLDVVRIIRPARQHEVARRAAAGQLPVTREVRHVDLVINEAFVLPAEVSERAVGIDRVGDEFQEPLCLGVPTRLAQDARSQFRQ